MGRASVGQSWAERVLLAALAVVAALVGVGSAPAAATTTPPPPGVRAIVAPQGAVDAGTTLAVSCPAVGACVGVGQGVEYTPGKKLVPVAFRQVGSSWTDTVLPLPSGMTTGFVDAISCPTTRWCVALGAGAEASGTSGDFVEIRTSGTWVAAAAPANLDEVSCSAPGSCTAVGFGDNASARLEDGAWHIETAPPTAVFEGVACAPEGTCVAVGEDTIYRQNGSAWSATALPVSAGTTDLQGVACPTAASCTAVGYNLDSGAYTAVVVAITPTSETPITITGADAPPELTGVTCASAAWCYASAYAENQAVILSGGTWTAATANFSGMSCPAANRCVGPAGRGTFVVDRYGTWRFQSVPSNAGPSTTALSGVSCWSAGQCEASGLTDLLTQPIALAVNRDRGQWNATALVARGFTPGALDAVSCVPSDDCTAVGGPGVATTSGGGWVTEQLPSNSKVPGISLDSVSCWASTQCVAVGTSTSGPGRPVIARVTPNGDQPAPLALPAVDGQASLTSVSCTSATRCAAVGSVTVGKSTRPLVAWTTGSTWQHESLGSGVLNAVSCPPTGSCVAVGTRVGHDMVATRSGSGWKATVSSAPTHAPPTTLSCPARGTCWSTASTGPNSLELVSVSPTNARAVRAISETGQYTASLTGISCPTTSSCTVVGTGNGPRGSVSLVGLFDPS